MGAYKQDAIARGELHPQESDNTDPNYGLGYNPDMENEHDLFELNCVIRRLQNRNGTAYVKRLLDNSPLPF